MAVAVATLFAMRDALGFGDDEPLSRIPYGLNDHIWGCIRLFMLALAATVTWRAAHGRMGRILAGSLIGISFNNNWQFYSVDDPLLWPSIASNYLGLGFGLMNFVRFASLYENDDPRGLRARLARTGPILGAAAALFGTLWWVSLLVETPPRPIFDRLFWIVWDAVNLIVIAAAILGVKRVSGEARSRMICVAVAFCIGAGGTALHGFDRIFQHDTIWANGVDNLAQAFLALGLAYALIWREALGPDFIVDRVVLFGAIAVILTAGFKIVEVIADKIVASHDELVPENVRVSQNAVELGLSVVVALTFKWLEVRVERLLERLRGEEPAERPANDLRATLALDEARIGELTRRVRTLETERRKRRNHRKKRRRR